MLRENQTKWSWKKLDSQAVLVQLVLFQVLLSMLFFLPDHPMICAKTFIIKPISLQDIFKKKRKLENPQSWHNIHKTASKIP